MGTGEHNAGGNPAMDYYPIQGGVEILPVAYATESGIRSDLMSHLAAMQTTLPYLTYIRIHISHKIPVYKERVIHSYFVSLPSFKIVIYPASILASFIVIIVAVSSSLFPIVFKALFYKIKPVL